MVEMKDMGESLRRPYAAAANVLGVLDRVRRINLPDVIDNDFLGVTGVPDMSLGRVQEALRFLGLIEPNGRPTETLRAIASASDDEFRDLLSAAIRSAYADDFNRVNPEVDTQGRMVSAFKRYEPRSQTERMVMLWLGLLRAVGSPVLEAPRQRGMKGSRPTTARSSTARAQSAAQPTKSRASTPRSPSQLEQPAVPHVLDPNLLFGVTVQDIGALPPDEFEAVWGALGKIARARAQSLKAAQAMANQARDRQENGEEDLGQ